ncbi:MAG: aminotransferase class V-fold PLP-dependent enzyme [Clostridia bacterium]|nr:aminotransferase class V-fold PLP-dependent enzyme [Clostridia bacterium]
MIYLDNAATSMMKPPCVARAVTEALSTLGNASRGAHEGALNTSRLLYGTRKKLAEFFGCPRPEQVIFTNNATEALNIAIGGTIHEGDHAITTVLEHNSVLRPLYRLQRVRGVELSFVQADRLGRVDYGDFERLIRPNTRAIVCTHASNLTGNRLDIDRVGAIARAHGLLLIVDASQTAGAASIDMAGSGVSLLCFTGHKSMLGPQGTGGLCINGDIDVDPFKVGGTGVQSFLTEQPREYPTRLEAGTLNGHGIAGLSAALDFIRQTGVETIHAHEIGLCRRFHEAVASIPGVRIYGDFSTWARSPVVALNVGDVDSALVSDALACDYGIATRAGAHCAPLMHRALGTEAQGAVRFSFGWFNTEGDVDAAVDAVRAIARRLI